LASIDPAPKPEPEDVVDQTTFSDPLSELDDALSDSIADSSTTEEDD